MSVPILVRANIRLLSLFLLLGLSGCGSLAQTTVGRQVLQPFLKRSAAAVQTRSPVGSTVFLRGTVGDRIPLLDSQLYELQDQTGSVWVLTSDRTLEPGETVFIQGTVRQSDISWNENQVEEVYIQEEHQFERQ